MRSGCCTPAGIKAHARRKFFDARPTSPELADEAIALIRAIYEVEHAAVERGIVGSAEINAQLYLADVLMRVQDHPRSQIDDLPPWNWRPQPGD